MQEAKTAIVGIEGEKFWYTVWVDSAALTESDWRVVEGLVGAGKSIYIEHGGEKIFVLRPDGRTLSVDVFGGPSTAPITYVGRLVDFEFDDGFVIIGDLYIPIVVED